MGQEQLWRLHQTCRQSVFRYTHPPCFLGARALGVYVKVQATLRVVGHVAPGVAGVVAWMDS
eukprot:9162640-Lingulodinium_polyedra.AAC.1